MDWKPSASIWDILFRKRALSRDSRHRKYTRTPMYLKRLRRNRRNKIAKASRRRNRA